MVSKSTLIVATSNDACDCLFGDDDGTLSGICFDLDEEKQPNEARLNASSWCRSSSSSCCSLCRPMPVSGADDDSNEYMLANDFSLRAGIGMRDDDSASQKGFVCPDHPIARFCSCNHNMSLGSCSQCENLAQVPIKSISFRQRCDDSTETDVKSNTNYTSKYKHDCISESFVDDDTLCHLVKYLDVSSLLRLRECNRRLRETASNNYAGWKDRCLSLWSSKANVCSTARETLARSIKIDQKETPDSKYTAMQAYKIALTDARHRKEVSFEEICFDASSSTGIIWSFRFKESAGRDWTSWDPWWNGQDARKLVFLKDGTIMQVYPPGPEGSAKSHNGTELYDVFSERTDNRNGIDAPGSRIEMKWRFVNRPLDLPARPKGAYVRITVGGRDVPTYVVRRSPNGNWGFILESCWGVYASFEMAPRLPGPIYGRRRRLRRTRTDGSRWVVEDSDSDSVNDLEYERERMRNVRRRIDLFIEESAMTQDGHSQWREALLYNIGAVTLPEGV
ncbi:hypothetical protein ACHAWF_011729 [Thalassiosira exigua]